MDYETEKLLEDITKEIYCELDEIRSRRFSRPDSFADGMRNSYNGELQMQREASRCGHKAEWQEYWAK